MLEVIDIEASGLGSASYPIEIGIALANGTQHSWLIRPVADWDHWCTQAESVHGISREQLLEQGVSVREVCEALNHYCQTRTLYSDCWVYDNSWLHLLFVSAGIRQTFSLSPIERELDEQSLDTYSAFKKRAQRLLDLPPHRAGNDARIIQAALTMLLHRPKRSSVTAIKKPTVAPAPSYYSSHKRVRQVAPAS